MIGVCLLAGKNPEQVRGFFEDFLKLTHLVDSDAIQLAPVEEQYAISFRKMPSDEDMKGEIQRMLLKYQ